MAQYVKGIDVSKWQPGVDWRRLREQEIRFAFIKATQGESGVDPRFADHWAGARQAGILRGAYHFMDPDMDGRRQAENFLRTVAFEPGDLPPVLDIETVPVEKPKGKKGVKGAGTKAGKGKKGTKGADTDRINAQIVDCANAWLEVVRKKTGRTPLVYSRAHFLDTRLTVKGKAPAWARKYPVWVAQFFDLPVHEQTLPDQAKGWQPFTFWQYSDCGTVDGVFDNLEMTVPAPKVDLDFYRGTLAELYQFAGAPLPPEDVV